MAAAMPLGMRWMLLRRSRGMGAGGGKDAVFKGFEKGPDKVADRRVNEVGL